MRDAHCCEKSLFYYNHSVSLLATNFHNNLQHRLAYAAESLQYESTQRGGGETTENAFSSYCFPVVRGSFWKFSAPEVHVDAKPYNVVCETALSSKTLKSFHIYRRQHSSLCKCSVLAIAKVSVRLSVTPLYCVKTMPATITKYLLHTYF